MPLSGRHIEIRGVVQGVGFRPFVYVTAMRDGITGRVRNDSTGVVIDAFGTDEALSLFFHDLASEAPMAAKVRQMDWSPIPYEALADFAIVASAASQERNVSIPPDLAICDDCLREIFDSHDRRYRYPFTNCTNCGPRYSIVREIPYDRVHTTMKPFVMCAACQAEYDDPRNRRFHAQPNACPDCGPALSIATPEGREISTETPVLVASRALKAQLIVAIKGIGGFHLACDARSNLAVNRLRERKHRDTKPLAVMVASLEAAEAIAELTGADRKLLTSTERPIVLVPRRPQAAIAPSVGGANPLIGLFLPYTPLHHILLREAGMPLVMTSGNLSDEPMVADNREALHQLHNVADLFLLHDREIETRVDDSVARVIGGAPVLLRRARGYVPRGIEVDQPFAEPVLGCGAHLKNAICIGAGTSAFLGPHVGDLETVSTYTAFEKSIQQMKRFVGVEPSLVAHDLHPDYFSTRYANALDGVRAVAVQHHHAHIVSAMAEHRLREPVLGFAYDGTGYGTDGTLWGSEMMIADARGYERVATFREIPLAGGDQAIRHVWRIALALLDEAFEGAPPLDALPLFRTTPPLAIESVRQMIDKRINAPRARGLGRYFDALGAIGLGMPDARYEGEVAFLWNMAADPKERGRYPVVIREGSQPWTVDLRPLVRAAVNDLLSGRTAATVSARFHNTISEVTIELARTALAARGEMPVVLSGGCFQNALLTESILRGLAGTNRVFMNRDIPPGDGGLSLGQVIVANALHGDGGQSSLLPEERKVLACA